MADRELQEMQTFVDSLNQAITNLAVRLEDEPERQAATIIASNRVHLELCRAPDGWVASWEFLDDRSPDAAVPTPRRIEEMWDRD